MAYSKKKQQKLVSSLTSIGALAGDNNIGVAGGIKGLEMSLEQSKCNEEAKAVRDGLFKVAIMGTFTGGKSTVINALIGAKILPESTLPSTAILTYINYGTDENVAYVYMNDEILPDGSVKAGECRKMSVNAFKEEYKYTNKDWVEFNEKGTVERFARVKHAVIYCSKPLMEGGVSIVDSPGLEDKSIATELALQIAQEAQAIIYVVTEKGFSQPDRDYISKAFRNCQKNVFFVLNKFDLVEKQDRPVAIEKLKLELKDVFTDESGNYNDELCERRVFGISALRALDSRRGITYDKDLEIEVPLDETKRAQKFEMSWFGPFERELETFLTTDARCVAQYQKCFNQMASTYRNAEKQIADYITIFKNEIQMDAKKKAECERIIKDIESSIKLTETTFDNCSLQIQNAVSDLLNSCATKIDASWEQDMVELANKVDLGTLKFMWNGLKQMNPLASKRSKEEEMKKFAQKFIDVVTDYFTDKVETYISDNRGVVDAVAQDCQKRLNISMDKLDGLFDNLAKEMMKGKNINVNNENKNWLQIMISAYLGDFSASFKGATDGKATWVEYLKKTIFNTVWQFVLMSLVDGGIGVLLAISIEYLQSKNNKNETVKKMLGKSKDGILKTIKLKTEEIRDSLNKDIAININKEKETKCSDAVKKLHDQQVVIRNIEDLYNSHNCSLEKEEVRFNKILSGMFNEASDAFAVVFGKQITLQQFKGF